MIELRDVSHSYTLASGASGVAGSTGGGANFDKILAIQDLSLKIDEGERIAIIGHNASGKSTLAKLINGLITPTKGEVWVDGINTRNRDKISDIRQKVGVVFQNPDSQLMAAMVEEDVAFGVENLSILPAEIRVRVNEALKAVDMLEYLSHPPHLLSGGQKQKVAIAGVLAMKPKYLILDEPTSLLDPCGSAEVMEILAKLNKEYKMTVVQITHSPEEAVLADRLIVMNQGKVLFDSPPPKVFSQINLLRSIGLEAPEIAILGRMLSESGIKVDPEAMTVKDMVDCLKWTYV